MILKDFNDAHSGETIFVLGNGEELYHLTDEQKALMKDYTVIGTNYSHMMCDIDYMISGHFSQILYAQNFANMDNIKAMFFQADREFFEPYNLKKLIRVKVNRIHDNPKMKMLRRVGEGNGNYLCGATNIGLSVTNLAYMMGAKRVVYIGFNQMNRLHFYDVDEGMKQELRDNIVKLRSKYRGKHRFDNINKDWNMFLNHMLPVKELRKTTFFTPNTIPTLKRMFNQMKNNGVEIISTAEKSRLIGAGATYLPLDTVLNDTRTNSSRDNSSEEEFEQVPT